MPPSVPPPTETHLHATPAGPPWFAFGALSTVGLPPGAAHANLFSFCNAINWGIVLGAPVILYAKSLGASSLVLGLIAALTPLLVTLQIPAAHWLPRLGYRRLMLAGWTSRTLVVVALALVPLLPGSDGLHLTLVLAGLLIFGVLRGVASGVWMPWMSELIPTTVRGRFFSRDQFFGQSGSLVALLAAALVLRGAARPWQYALALAISAAGGLLSLVFMRRIPEVATPEQMKRSGARVPWTAMLAFRPFFRLIVFNVLFALTLSGLGAFSVAYLRGTAGYSDSAILLIATLSVVGALLTLPWSGPLMDRVGSQPVYRVCAFAFAGILAGWWAVATGLIAPHTPVIGGLYLLSGMAGVNFAVANARMQSATIPLMGRNHFFALFTVITSLAAGISPIAWGGLLDALGDYAPTTGGIIWNRYAIYFAAASVLSLAALTYSFWLEEAPAAARSAAPPPT
jgi:MFS family permease